MILFDKATKTLRREYPAAGTKRLALILGTSNDINTVLLS